VLAADAVPIVLGGDHSITEPEVVACAAVHGPIGLVHFDTHTDTGTHVFGVERSQRERGITSFFMHDIRDRGITPLLEQTLAIVGDGPVFLTVDVDVLDPAFAPGTGTPEPGGMTPLELLPSVRRVA
jgi:arginase family enzyme